MMMKFTKIAEDMQGAMVQFCMEQGAMNGYVDEETVENMVESAFAVMNRIYGAALPKVPLYRYHMYAGDEFTDEIFPNSIKENGVLYDNIIHLGTFKADGYYDKLTDDTVYRGYDVVYDTEEQKIRLLYRIQTKDNSVTTLYRVDTELFEDFDVYEFIIDISVQIISRLKQSVSYAEFIRKDVA